MAAVHLEASVLVKMVPLSPTATIKVPLEVRAFKFSVLVLVDRVQLVESALLIILPAAPTATNLEIKYSTALMSVVMFETAAVQVPPI